MHERARCRGDRGLTVVEAAFVTPIFFALILGLFEFGLIFRDYLVTADAAVDATKVGATQGPDIDPGNGANADYAIIERLREDMSTVPVDWIERVVIFKAPSSSTADPVDQVPSTCKNGTGLANRCTVFNDVREAFRRVQVDDVGYFDCAMGAACWDPLSRNDGPTPGQIDYLGVYIQLDRELITGLYGDAFSFETAAILRLEPGSFT